MQLGRFVSVVRQRQHVSAVGAERQLSQGARKASAFFDQGEQAARRHVQTGQRAAQVANGFTHQPVVFVRQQGRVRRQDGRCIARSLEHPGADVQFVGAHVQDGVIQFAHHLQRPPVHACGFDSRDVGGLRRGRGFDGESGDALGAVDFHGDVGVSQGIGCNGAVQRSEGHAFGTCGADAASGQFLGTGLHGFFEHGGLGDRIDQTPVHGFLTAHTFDAGAEDVGQVVAHMALVGHAGQAAGARQHTQQRHFGQRHGAGAVIDQHDFIASQSQLVAAASAGAVQGRDEFQAVVLAGVFDAVAGFVGELAEVHFPAVGGHAQHEDVGTGAEHAVLQAGHHHRAHFGVLKADALQCVVQLDVHTQVVAVELEFVARADAGVFVDVDRQGGDLAIKGQIDVFVLGGVGLVIDLEGSAHVCLHG